MLSRRNDRSGVSEIVGALMLVLIVVVAASSFAVFVSQQQKLYQDQQLADQQRALENVDVLSVTPVADIAFPTQWGSLTFNVVNLYTDESIIDSFTLNGKAVQAYEFKRTGDPSWTEMSTGQYLHLKALEQVVLNIIVSNANWTSGKPSLFDTSSPFKTTDYIKIDAFTYKLNDFSKTFIPPTALGVVKTDTQWNAGTGNYETFLELDGTQSTAYGNSTYILSWSWTVVNISISENIALSGSKVRANIANANVDHTITLTVTDNNGMIGKCSLTYHDTGPGTPTTPTPPSAIPMITTETQWNPVAGAYTQFLILDGTESSVGTGTFITSWAWTEHSVLSNTDDPALSGPKVRFDHLQSGQYDITLTVTDNLGRTAVKTISYTFP